MANYNLDIIMGEANNNFTSIINMLDDLEIVSIIEDQSAKINGGFVVVEFSILTLSKKDDRRRLYKFAIMGDIQLAEIVDTIKKDFDIYLSPGSERDLVTNVRMRAKVISRNDKVPYVDPYEPYVVQDADPYLNKQITKRAKTLIYSPALPLVITNTNTDKYVNSNSFTVPTIAPPTESAKPIEEPARKSIKPTFGGEEARLLDLD